MYKKDFDEVAITDVEQAYNLLILLGPGNCIDFDYFELLEDYEKSLDAMEVTYA